MSPVRLFLGWGIAAGAVFLCGFEFSPEPSDVVSFTQRRSSGLVPAVAAAGEPSVGQSVMHA
jgi:hypothetical protein